MICECSTMREEKKISNYAGVAVAGDAKRQWVQSMKQKLEPYTFYHKKEPSTIYRVPRHIRRGDESAYEPKIISIGPYHHGKEGLQAMEEHKWRYLHQFLSRNSNVCLENYIDGIQELESRARSCYLEVPNLKSNEFVEMMVLDGCFIVELLLKENDGMKNDPIRNTRWMLPLICHDMLLLENQVPFFVLQCFFDLQGTLKEVNATSLQELAINFFMKSLLCNTKIPHNKPIPRTRTAHHLLHLVHSSLLPTKEPEKANTGTHRPLVPLMFRRWSSKHLLPACTSLSDASNNISPSPPPTPPPREPVSCTIDIQEPVNRLKKDADPVVGLKINKPEGLAHLIQSLKLKSVIGFLAGLKGSKREPPPQPPKSIPGATELHEAGVKFKMGKEAESFLEVKFNQGVMVIPHLLIDCNTNSLFRNFIAFEQCYPKSETHFTSYAFFMDCIVNTPKDVALLGHHKIIEHWLGTDGDVALLFNRLCCGITIDTQNSYLSSLFDQVTDYCKTEWHMWRACLKRDYFSNPWAIISLVAAVILLFLAITQTFFSSISYLRPTPEM